MFCPTCGQEQINNETRFCSRCGFLLTGVTQLIANGGNLPFIQLPQTYKPQTPRKKGLKKGLMIFLMTALAVPLIAIIASSLGLRGTVVAITAVLFGIGGILRMAYALLLESNEPNGVSLEETVFKTAKAFRKNSEANALPPQTSIPVEDYYAPSKAGVWRDTNDLTPSAIEETTRQLRGEDR